MPAGCTRNTTQEAGTGGGLGVLQGSLPPSPLFSRDQGGATWGREEEGSSSLGPGPEWPLPAWAPAQWATRPCSSCSRMSAASRPEHRAEEWRMVLLQPGAGQCRLPETGAGLPLSLAPEKGFCAWECATDLRPSEHTAATPAALLRARLVGAGLCLSALHGASPDLAVDWLCLSRTCTEEACPEAAGLLATVSTLLLGSPPMETSWSLIQRGPGITE